MKMTPDNEDERYMKLALEEARLAAESDEVPVGAVVVCKGRTIARAHNLTEALNDVTAHAEMQAVTAAEEALGGKYLGDCTLYVTLEPCPMCAGALGLSQLGRLVYGASDPKKGYSLFAPGVLHPKTKVQAGILCEECSAVVSNFFKKKRSKK